MFCSQCGEQLKENAQFCHACGAGVEAASKKTQGKVAAGEIRTGSWLHSFGAFLLIPIFAGVIVLLFWVNKEPGPVGASDSGKAQQEAPSMAVMSEVRASLQRLQARVDADATDLEAIDSLAVMYSISQSYDKAKFYYEKHLEVEPDNRDIKIALALTNHSLKDSDRAIALLQEVLDDEPNYVFGLFYMAQVQADLHHHEEARKYWQKIVDQYPDTEFAKLAKERLAK